MSAWKMWCSNLEILTFIKTTFFMFSWRVSMLLTTCQVNIFPSYDSLASSFILIFVKLLFSIIRLFFFTGFEFVASFAAIKCSWFQPTGGRPLVLRLGASKGSFLFFPPLHRFCNHLRKFNLSKCKFCALITPIFQHVLSFVLFF